VLLPFIGIIVFTGVYPKPMLERIQPSVDALITHIEERTGFEEPQPEIEAEPATDDEGDGG
jgi:NADH-quinone oxidoreductase subunit M